MTSLFAFYGRLHAKRCISMIKPQTPVLGSERLWVWTWQGVAAGSAANDVTVRGRYSTHAVISNPRLFSDGYYPGTVFPRGWGEDWMFIEKVLHVQQALAQTNVVYVVGWGDKKKKGKTHRKYSASETFGPAPVWPYFCRRKHVWQGLSANHAFCLYVGQREQGEVSQYLLETEKQSQREIDQFTLHTPWINKAHWVLQTNTAWEEKEKEKKKKAKSFSVWDPTSQGQLWWIGLIRGEEDRMFQQQSKK